MKKYNICTIYGDGIGPEVLCEGAKTLRAVGEKYGIDFNFKRAYMGGEAYDKYGVPLPEKTVKLSKESDAVFLGAVGGAKWDSLPVKFRPEAALLGIRKTLGLYANLRPVKAYKETAFASPLKAEALANTDFIIIRELTGGIYFADKNRGSDEFGSFAYDTEKYYDYEINRITQIAFETAMKRRKKLVCVDKANVLESSRFWREKVLAVAEKFPEVELSFMYVDNAAMSVIKAPSSFDVVLCSNLFGDILSDEGGAVTGSLGMLPSASLGSGTALYEPVHGSAPDIAGSGKANPLGTILSAAMLLRYTADDEQAAAALENAVGLYLEKGFRTADIYTGAKHEKLVTTSEAGDEICKLIN